MVLVLLLGEHRSKHFEATRLVDQLREVWRELLLTRRCHRLARCCRSLRCRLRCLRLRLHMHPHFGFVLVFVLLAEL